MSRVLVVGSGIAGLSFALSATTAGHEVTVVTKGELGESNTRYAQGGVAAAIIDEDSVASHISDTLAAGAGLCDPAAVRVLCSQGPDRIRELMALGVAFDTHGDELAHGLEAAHSFPRILHAGGDATGAAIERALVARLRERRVATHEHAFLLALRQQDGPGTAVTGARVELDDGSRVDLDADVVVLATGGAGQLYPYTSNPAGATGDGIACAARAGATLADLEFYQFHPTTLARPGTFLISEAVRGEGAVLRNAAGRRFMADVDGAELAPRDVVARAVFAESTRQAGAPVLLDATHLGAEFLARRFPSIDAAVRAAGLDWAREPIPITPAAHYWMGGIATDLWGRTSLPGLLAIGECARTGVHGANRLASNSLLEGAVFAHRAARTLPHPTPGEQGFPPAASALSGKNSLFGVEVDGAGGGRAGVDSAEADEVRAVMWESVGLVRDADGLAEAVRTLSGWALTAPDDADRSSHEAANLTLLGLATAQAAAARPASVGAHYRRDDARPETTTSEELSYA